MSEIETTEQLSLKEKLAYWQRVREELKTAPVVDVYGVVAPTGLGCSNVPPETFWTLSFTLEAWRIGKDGNLESQILSVSKVIGEEETKQWYERIKQYLVIHIKAQMVRESPLGNPVADMVEFVGIESSDSDLNQFAEQLQQPVVYEDSQLGVFTLDRTVNWYEADVTWGGVPVRLNLSANEPDELQAALKVAQTLWKRTLWTSPRKWNRRVQDFAVQSLLPLKNTNWLGDGESELTAEQFKRRMRLESITIYPNGDLKFWHDDGGLFFGHSIQISGNLVKGLNFADIPG